MSIEVLWALALFSFVSSITPGPNNIMLMNSGASYGFKQTLPHMFGVGLGFTLMVALVGLGIMQIFEQFPLSYQILKVLSIVYLLYLAYKIASSSSAISNNSDQAKPFTFLQAAMFQWVNPKAWTMALTAISVYATSTDIYAVVFVAIVFGLVNLPCISLWVFMGQKLQRVLSQQKHLKMFNITMAFLLVLSVVPALFE